MIIELNKLNSYFINLDEHPERAASASSAIKECGLTIVNRYPAIAFKPPRTGLALTFMNLFEEISDHPEPVLICEDDIKKNPSFELDRLEIPDDADALYVGITSWGVSTTINQYLRKDSPAYSAPREPDRRIKATRVNQDIFRIYNMLSAHGIIMINPKYTKFLQGALHIALESGGHQDQIRAYTMPYWNIYALDIPMFFQDDPVRPKERNLQLSLFTNAMITGDLSLL
jgi:hypothetical protein